MSAIRREGDFKHPPPPQTDSLLHSSCTTSQVTVGESSEVCVQGQCGLKAVCVNNHPPLC